MGYDRSVYVVETLGGCGTMTTPAPAWLTRWQQTPDDELLYAPQYGGTEERCACPDCQPIPVASLRQMADERWPHEEPWE
jgi:hypothetical protein